jgi:hypothetical protein
MKFARLLFTGLFYVPSWVWGRNGLMKFFFVYMMINAAANSKRTEELEA